MWTSHDIWAYKSFKQSTYDKSPDWAKGKVLLTRLDWLLSRCHRLTNSYELILISPVYIPMILTSSVQRVTSVMWKAALISPLRSWSIKHKQLPSDFYAFMERPFQHLITIVKWLKFLSWLGNSYFTPKYNHIDAPIAHFPRDITVSNLEVWVKMCR